jgi:hypothetical protein
MSTIDELITYPLSDRDKLTLDLNGYTNWCWAKDGFNFSDFLVKVQNFKRFDSHKFRKFSEDMRDLCSYTHDIDFARWGNLLDFLWANYRFANNVFKLTKWTSFIARIWVFLTIFVPLSIFWWKRFIWGNKRSLKYLLNNKYVQSKTR